jgi:hypothetical protein
MLIWAAMNVRIVSIFSSLWLIKVQQLVVENEGFLACNMTHSSKVRIQTPVVLGVDVTSHTNIF